MGAFCIAKLLTWKRLNIQHIAKEIVRSIDAKFLWA